MRYSGLFFLLLIIGAISAGCTQPPAAQAPVSAPEKALIPTPVPVPAEVLVPAAETTAIPQQVVTIIHQVSQVRNIKDSELMFTLQVPVEWSASTYRLENPENFIGFMYQTDLVKNNTFYIHTFTNYRSRDQNYRDECRSSSPAPNMTTVTINDIIFDRYESAANGRTNVTYVARSSSMNEAGFVSVLAFSADDSNRFEKEDFEKVVRSFRYFTKDNAATVLGEEIYRIPPEELEAGNMRSASGKSESSSAGSSSSSSGTRTCGRR